jgi:alkylation response protein AidB-like acyl-CoA dehydrogenase
MSPGYPRGLDEFALECSILKVACSETLDYVADEMLQVHGGYGYTEEFQAARGYRDSRINRIFEGTNEINRLFIPGSLMRRAQKGRFPLMQAITKVAKEMLDFSSWEEGSDELANARAFLGNAKRLVLFLSGVAHQRFGDKLLEQQEVLGALSDLMMDVFLGESAVLRVLKARSRGATTGSMVSLAMIFVNESAMRMEQTAKTALAAISDGDELRTQLGMVRRLLRWTPINSVALRRHVAQRLCERGSYGALVQ